MEGLCQVASWPFLFLPVLFVDTDWISLILKGALQMSIYLFEAEAWEVACYVTTVPHLPVPLTHCHFSLPVCALPLPASTFLLTVRVLPPSHFPSPTPKSPPAQLQRDLFLIPQSSRCLLPAFHVHSLVSGPLQGPSHTWS